jgi:hypothetical protein
MPEALWAVGYNETCFEQLEIMPAARLADVKKD